MGKVLHASYSGYWPSCIITYPTKSDSPANPFLPIGMTLEDVMKLFWRVKSWKMKFLYDSKSFETEEIKTLYSIFDGNNIVGYSGDQEEKLVCSVGGSLNITYARTLTNYTYGGGFSVFIAPAKFKDQDNNLYFPGCFGLFQVTLGEAIDVYSGQTLKAPNSTNSGVLKIFDYSIQLYKNASQKNLSIELAPYSYWSYGGTWDTKTGKKLT